MDRSTGRTDLISLVAITAAFTIGLHQLGSIPGLGVNWADPLGWIATAAPEDLVGAAARHIGLTLGYWVLATTGIYTAWSMRHRRPPRWVVLVTLPAVRRVIDRALAATLVAAVVAGPVRPALAEGPPPPPPPIVFDAADDGIPVPHIRLSRPEETTTPINESPTEPTPSTAPLPPAPMPDRPSLLVTLETDRHTVTDGENLWAIAEGHLAAKLGMEPTEGALAEYWRRLVAMNTPTLRSGDPNLIFPGEMLALPEITP